MDIKCVCRKQSALGLILIFSAVTPTGCTTLLVGGAAAAGAGSVAYVMGDLESMEFTLHEVSVEATAETIGGNVGEQLGFHAV